MKLWTHHPEGYKIDAPDIHIDPTKGGFWNRDEPGFRYRDVLPAPVKKIGTDQFLWCCTVRGEFMSFSEDQDLVEWELEVEHSQVLAFYNVSIWDDLVWGRSEGRNNLILEPENIDHNLGALVRVPLEPNSSTCLGPLEVKSYRKPNR